MKTVWVFKYEDNDVENNWQKIFGSREAAQRHVNEIDKAIQEEKKVTHRSPWFHDSNKGFGISYETEKHNILDSGMLGIEAIEEIVYE